MCPKSEQIRLAQRFDRNLLAYALLRAYLEGVRLRFGEFTLDTDARQLYCAGIDRDLSPQGFAFLNLLIDHRPRALSKRQIYEHLWPNVSFSPSPRKRAARQEVAVRIVSARSRRTRSF